MRRFLNKINYKTLKNKKVFKTTVFGSFLPFIFTIDKKFACLIKANFYK